MGNVSRETSQEGVAENRPERDLMSLNRREAWSDIRFRKINLEDGLELTWD